MLLLRSKRYLVLPRKRVFVAIAKQEVPSINQKKDTSSSKT